MQSHRRFALLLSLGLLATFGTAQASEAVRELARCERGGNSFQCARAIERSQAIGDLAAYFERAGGTLRIKTARKTLRFVDLNRDADSLFYSYFDHVPALRLHVLHEQFYEGSAFLVVSHDAGATARIDNFPIASPDARRFAVVSDGSEGGYIPTSFEIWRLDRGRPRMEYRYAPEGAAWTATAARWTDATTLRLEGKCEGQQAATCPAIASQHDGKWGLKLVPRR